jgi:hypothetical protein
MIACLFTVSRGQWDFLGHALWCLQKDFMANLNKTITVHTHTHTGYILQRQHDRTEWVFRADGHVVRAWGMEDGA